MRRDRRRGMCFAALLAAVCAGCGARTTLLDEGESSGAGGNPSGGNAGRGGSGACDGLPGPPMIAVGSPGEELFCIDATEVSNRHYDAFLAADVPTSAQPSHCAWNVVWLHPAWHWPPTTDYAMDFPMVHVDWCDALAYCTWVGKRLCGRIGGGPLDEDSLLDPLQNEWLHACTAAGTRKYPYGDEHVTGTCVTADYNGEPDEPGEAEPSQPIGSASGCVGGFPGLHDMSGSVSEYVDDVDGVTGEMDDAVTFGGSVFSLGSASSCTSTEETFRSLATFHNGFRCCKDY